tara:strand:- start:782 stop:1546 length:765 start_codon:yes stop_codon:yes gene_type:complete
MIFSKKNSFFLLFSCFIVGNAFSQITDSTKVEKEQIRYSNIIKINTISLAFSNLSLIYERGIMPRVSAGIGVGFKLKGAVPSLLDIDNTLITGDFDGITGFTITPEAKYYLRACDPGKLEGFYTGVYFRYTNYKTGANFNHKPLSGSPQSYHSDIRLREYGVGVQLGYQMLIKERFSIDFLFIGPRFASYKLGYKFDNPPSEAFLKDLSGAINEVIDRFGGDANVDIEKEGQAEANSSFSFVNMRFGISLGYAF